MSEAAAYLNLGCGSRYHPDWINIDIVASGPEVIQHDISRGIPLPDASCGVVYHAAVLEHMRRSDGKALIAECYRVLKPGGIIRVGVPDLERIAQLYLSKLTAIMDGNEVAVPDYDWMMLELYDQSVRETSGGDMLGYLKQSPLPNEGFVYERIGEEGRHVLKILSHPVSSDPNLYSIFLSKLKSGPHSLLKAAYHWLLVRLLTKEDRRAWKIGRFRLAGEVHQWAYDRYSLARLLKQAGFQDPQLKSADTSNIPNWVTFNLDTLPNGQVVKPDLLFMEAIKR